MLSHPHLVLSHEGVSSSLHPHLINIFSSLPLISSLHYHPLPCSLSASIIGLFSLQRPLPFPFPSPQSLIPFSPDSPHLSPSSSSHSLILFVSLYFLTAPLTPSCCLFSLHSPYRLPSLPSAPILILTLIPYFLPPSFLFLGHYFFHFLGLFFML